MRRDLLKVLIKALRAENLNKDGFNLKYWAKGGAPKDSTLSCGTTACAIGLATTLPEFRNEGLRLILIGTYTDNKYIPIIRDKNGEIISSGWDCIQDLLELNQFHAYKLFSIMSYIDGNKTTPDEVATRIEEFIS